MEQSATNSLLDAYAPAQIAMRVREVGETKATYTDAGSDWIAWYQRD